MTGRPDPTEAVNQQGFYAGAVTRLVAFMLDQAIVTGLFAGALAVVAWVVDQLFSVQISSDRTAGISSVAFICWWFLYYAYPWAVSGKTPGMAMLGIRVVREDGSPASAREASLRVLGMVLCFLTLGIGFLPIVFARRRRGLQDKVAGTAVVYSWDARGARLRFLARQQREDEVKHPTPA